MTQPSPEYTAQLQQKAGYLKQRFAEFSLPEWQVFASPEKHYRMRAEFRVWHEGEHISYAMFEPGQKATTSPNGGTRLPPPIALLPNTNAPASSKTSLPGKTRP